MNPALRVPLVLVLAAGLASCGSADAAPASGVSATLHGAPVGGVLGTIEAIVDGEPRTWSVVTGSVKGEPYASAVWFQTPTGDLIASLGGYDTSDVPFESFDLDADRGLSLGDYEGSAFTILLMPGGGAEPYARALGEDSPGLTFAPVAAVQDLSEIYFGRAGTLNVTRLEFVEDRLTAEGTFEGSLATLEGRGPIEITAGRFSVEGVPPRSAMAGGR